MRACLYDFPLVRFTSTKKNEHKSRDNKMSTNLVLSSILRWWTLYLIEFQKCYLWAWPASVPTTKILLLTFFCLLLCLGFMKVEYLGKKKIQTNFYMDYLFIYLFKCLRSFFEYQLNVFFFFKLLTTWQVRIQLAT